MAGRNKWPPPMKMKASELINQLRVKSDTDCTDAATMLEAYLALADEIKQEKAVLILNENEREGYRAALEWVEKRIRQIAEGSGQ